MGAVHTIMTEDTTFDEYRVGYVSERWGVSDNCARALQLFELGYTVSGAAQHLPVSESTVKGYHRELMDTINENIVLSIAGAGRDGSFDVWGKRDASEYDSYNYNDGIAHAKEANNAQATDSREQIDPEFREPHDERNKGIRFENIPDELVTIRH